jgi:extracellular factor (EF) 3-hydroxypalmitic acid methyl ester biosynthesis protein
VAFFLKHAKRGLLNKGGRLFFANSIEENPFKVWMEYLADWKLNYRSEDLIRNLMADAGFDDKVISIKKDETRLTYFVEAVG